MKKAADAIVELQSYGVAVDGRQVPRADQAGSRRVEGGRRGRDRAASTPRAIERERTARKLKAAGILQQFEAEMGISAPPTATGTDVTPSVGGRVREKPGS